MTNFSGGIFRGGQEGYLSFGPEIAVLSPALDAIAAAPPTQILQGYCDLPGFTTNEGVTGLEGVGAYRDVDDVRGARLHTMTKNIRLGDKVLLQQALRTSTVTTPYKGLSVISCATGAVNVTDSSAAFTDVGRYGMINTATVNFQEGQMVTANLNAMFLARQVGVLSTRTYTEADLRTAAIAPLHWVHSDFILDPLGTPISYRNILQSASISINNNVRAEGVRKDQGDNHTLSRVPYALMPGIEKITVNYRLRSRPIGLQTAGLTELSLGAIQFTASNGLNTMTITIASNVIAQQAQEGIQPNATYSFSVSTQSRQIAIT